MQTLKETGQLKNYLGLFADKALTRLNTSAVINIAEHGSMNKKQIAEKLKMSRAKLYRKEARITDKEVRERLIPIVQISDIIYELYDKDKDKTMEWLMSPNHLFFNMSPFQMALDGKADIVLQKIDNWI